MASRPDCENLIGSAVRGEVVDRRRRRGQMQFREQGNALARADEGQYVLNDRALRPTLGVSWVGLRICVTKTL